MASLKSTLKKLAHKTELTYDEVALKLQRRFGDERPLHILPYLGYGTPELLTLKARVIYHKGARTAEEADGLWDNLLNAYRHIESDEIPYAQVRATFGTTRQVFTANDEGYADVRLPLDKPVAPGWADVALTLIEAGIPIETPVKATGRVHIPGAAAAYGVISDIDDTVMVSHATNYLKAARLMLLGNARTRLPFAGVAAFYRMLVQEGDGPANPLFYVSSSPWNLYTLLTDFFELQGLPRGPLFLKDYGVTADQLITSGHGKHKLAQIDRILATYPELPFVLIGDSGQKDPEIYRQVVEQYPGRIRAIYIRDVSDDGRDAEVEHIAAAVAAQGVPMELVPDSLSAAEHAVAIGLLSAAQLAVVEADVAADKADPSLLEAALDELGEE